MNARSLVACLAVTGLLASAVASPAAAGRRNRGKAKKARKGGDRSAQRGGGIIAAHPSLLEFTPLRYDAPNRMDFRHELPGGVPAYVVEDHDLPLVTVSITVRGGAYLDPAGKAGLAGLTAGLMRTGGAGRMDADAFDEEIDFLAANIGFGAGDTESSANLNVLTKDLEAGLDLLFAALRRPRFQQDRLDLRKKQIRQGLGRRNDQTTGIERREWIRLMYGDDHFESAMRTVASIDGISRADLEAFHRRVWHPDNFLVAVAGDVDTAAVLAQIGRRLEGWSPGARSPGPPSPTHRPSGNLYAVNKDDVNQTRVSIGHLASKWDDPDWPALTIMNEVLGGGGFTSRITRRVRSDEGLAYSAGSGWGFGRDYRRSFRASFQSRNEATARAIAIVLEELDRIRTEPVSAEELETAKNSFIETFPRRFSSAIAKASIFVDDDITGRPASWWATYRDEIRAVSAAAVLDAAKKHLAPGDVTILVVGKIDEVLKGDPEHPEIQLTNFAGEAGVLEIPLPEPESMVYPHGPRVIAGGRTAGAGG